MVIGMTPEEFWFGPVRLCGAYRAKWRAENENRDTDAWLHGYYAYMGFASALSQAFGGKGKGSPYIEKPLHMMHREREQERGDAGGVAFMQAFAEAVNKKRKQAAMGADGKEG